MSIQILRKCVNCGLEAKTIEDLVAFAVNKRNLFGRANLCYSCRNKLWVRTWKERNREKTRLSNRKRDQDPDKYNSRLLSKFIPIKDKCEICGSSINLQRHHPDYTNPLDFQTLCRKCHSKLNRKPLLIVAKAAKPKAECTKCGHVWIPHKIPPNNCRQCKSKRFKLLFPKSTEREV